MYKTVERLFTVGLITVPVSVVGFIALAIWTYHDSYAQYARLKSCLEQHQFKVMDGWQREDGFLEDFGWKFRTQKGTIAHINVYKNDHARQCNARAVGVQLLDEQYYSDGTYLSFSNPDLVKALDGKQLKTMDEMLENVDELLAWVQENPTFRVNYEDVEKNKNRYLNLFISPDE